MVDFSGHSSEELNNNNGGGGWGGNGGALPFDYGTIYNTWFGYSDWKKSCSDNTYRGNYSESNARYWSRVLSAASNKEVSAIIFGGSRTNKYQDLLGFIYTDGSSYYYSDDAVTDAETSTNSGSEAVKFQGAISTSATIATPGGGYTLELGTICDKSGNVNYFFSYGLAYGGELSIQSNYYLIRGDFNVKDWGGKSYTIDAGKGLISIGFAGNATDGYPEDSWPTTYSAIKFGFGPALGLGSYCRTNTILIPIPKELIVKNALEIFPTGFGH